MGEEWKDVKGYEGCYKVSSNGKIKSLTRQVTGPSGRKKVIPGVNSKQFLHPDGYYIINLSKNGIKKSHRVHRLVGAAFINNESELSEINHINEIKTDNRVQNLEWCTSRYNREYSKSKWWRFISPEGHKTIIFNLHRFCMEYNLSTSGMSFAYRKSGRSHKGWRAA